MTKKYSFIVPTYNSEHWIESCINSILAQSYSGFNLIILDSGSTDETLSWIKSLKDDRILIYETENRLGIVENWARIISIPKYEFMTIAGHDDIFETNYLETINNLIHQQPDASLYLTHFSFIDGNSKMIRPCTPMKERYNQADFFEAILKNTIEVTATGFMMRSQHYDSIKGIQDYPDLLYADIELWLQLIDTGYLVVSPKKCFSFRFHLQNTSKSTGITRVHAFERMVAYFKTLTDTQPALKVIANQNGFEFFKSFIVGSSHKLIYVPKEKRNGLTIDEIIASGQRSSMLLVPENKYQIENLISLRVAKLMDRISVLRKLFLFYKSFFKRTF